MNKKLLSLIARQSDDVSFKETQTTDDHYSELQMYIDELENKSTMVELDHNNYKKHNEDLCREIRSIT